MRVELCSNPLGLYVKPCILTDPRRPIGGARRQAIHRIARQSESSAARPAGDEPRRTVMSNGAAVPTTSSSFAIPGPTGRPYPDAPTVRTLFDNPEKTPHGVFVCRFASPRPSGS